MAQIFLSVKRSCNSEVRPSQGVINNFDSGTSDDNISMTISFLTYSGCLFLNMSRQVMWEGEPSIPLIRVGREDSY